MNKWYPEIQHHLPQKPIILVGTKMDLREDKAIIERMLFKKQHPVSNQQGNDLQSKIKANAYMGNLILSAFNSKKLFAKCFDFFEKECSALTNQGVKDVFDKAIRAVVNPEVDESKTSFLKRIFK